MDLSTMVVGSRVPYLNTDEVFYDGQPVAVVVAERIEAAQYAASLVEVDYVVLPGHVDFAVEQGRAKEVSQSLGMPTMSGRKGDAQAALASAPHRVDLRFTTPTQNHNAMEPHATTAVWDGDSLTVWDAAQNIDWFRKHLARRFDVPVEKVRVLAPFVGGGFGGKGFVWSGTLLTVMAARSTRRPVRMALTREGVHRTVGGRSPTAQRVALGATADGRLTALLHEAVVRTSPMGGSADQVVGASGELTTHRPSRSERRSSSSTSSPTRPCGPPASRWARSPWSPRWTSSHTTSGSTPSTCGSATSRPSPRCTAGRTRTAGSARS